MPTLKEFCAQLIEGVVTITVWIAGKFVKILYPIDFFAALIYFLSPIL
jgi:hypothetical protein